MIRHAIGQIATQVAGIHQIRSGGSRPWNINSRQDSALHTHIEKGIINNIVGQNLLEAAKLIAAIAQGRANNGCTAAKPKASHDEARAPPSIPCFLTGAFISTKNAATAQPNIIGPASAA